MALDPDPSVAATEAPLRLGVFGGTFDPIHVGHLIVAEEALARLSLDRVVFVPARVSPLKLPGTHFTAEDRVQMVELAIRDNPRFQVSRVDVDRTGPSYTLDTLRTLYEQHGEACELFFVMGLDSLATFHAWHRPKEIISLSRLVVVSRPGSSVDWEALERNVPGIRRATELIDTLQIGISSTDIRERMARGLPIRYRVPEAVEEYIRELGRRESR